MRIPGTHSGDIGRRWFLPRNQHDFAEAVGVELVHRAEILRQDFALAAVLFSRILRQGGF
jgi:hypothetical protein